MNAPQRPAAPTSGFDDDDIPTFEELAADPEIAALLDFDPVPRKQVVEGGWSPAKQQEFIARLAVHGSKNKACIEMAMHTTGMTKLQNSPGSKSFRAAWESAVDLARRRRSEKAADESIPFGARLPTIDHRKKSHAPGREEDWDEGGGPRGPLPGQVLNEHGEWEDEASYHRRADEAKDSIANKLRRSRRLFLHSISDDPAKRAAFEILTELPVDWDKAGQCLPQADEPWRKPSMRNADMLLTAEAGWLGAELVHGPDKKAELLREVNAWRAEQGLAPVGWKDE